jgi:hypothetical protein
MLSNAPPSLVRARWRVRFIVGSRNTICMCNISIIKIIELTCTYDTCSYEISLMNFCRGWWCGDRCCREPSGFFSRKIP